MMLFSDENGRISDAPPQVSLLDHGFLFGDSLYEVVRTYDGKLFTWGEHFDRLVKSGEKTGIAVEPLLPVLKNRAQEILKKLNEPNAALRIFVTRGVGKLHIDPRTCEKPEVYMAAWKFDAAAFSKPQRLAVVKTRRVSIHALDPSIKSGNYLNSVMAFREASLLGYDDAVFLNEHGELTELTTSNFGWVKEGRAFTSHTDCGILHGITRKILIDEGLMQAGRFQVDALRTADEAFVLSTFKEVLAVSEVRFEDGFVRKYALNQKTNELARAFSEIVKQRLALEPKLF